MKALQAQINRSKWEGDKFTRNRFRQHNRSMAMEGQGGRAAEMRLAKERLGKDFTDAEAGVWHNYVFKGGKRPSDLGGEMPAFPGAGDTPELNLPEYDEDQVSALTQKRAAPSIRRLRETTRAVTSGSFDNPNVKKMTVREALAGYGTGLEGIVAGAGRAASAEYGQQYAASVNAEMARYQGALNRQAQQYDTWSQGWLMERQQEIKDESDPYEMFDAFYGTGGQEE